MKMLAKILLSCFALALFTLPSCGSNNPEKEINAVMESRENAFNGKDLQEYLKNFSKDYTDKKGDINSLRKRMEDNFNVFEHIEFRHTNRDIFIKGDDARIVQNFTLDFSIKEEKHGVKGKEMFKLKKTTVGWLIAKGE